MAKIKFLRSLAGHRLFSHKYRMKRCSSMSAITFHPIFKFYWNITYYIHCLPRNQFWRAFLTTILLTFFVLAPTMYAVPTVTCILEPQLCAQYNGWTTNIHFTITSRLGLTLPPTHWIRAGSLVGAKWRAIQLLLLPETYICTAFYILMTWWSVKEAVLFALMVRWHHQVR